MRDTITKFGAKNMSDISIKAIRGIYETKTHTKEQVKNYKR